MWQDTAVENVSVGKVFYQALQRNTAVRVVLSGLKGLTDAKVRSKKDRWLNDAAKWFEDGTILISDEDTPALNALRKLFSHFFDLSEHDPAWDAGDGTYHALRQMPDVLRKPESEEQHKNRLLRRRGVNPLAGIGAHVGYGRK
jgi:hypothetical protein